MHGWFPGHLKSLSCSGGGSAERRPWVRVAGRRLPRPIPRILHEKAHGRDPAATTQP